MVFPNANTFSPHVAHGHVALPTLKTGCTVAVIGAGAFGTWAAIELLKRGYQLTLFDAWGAGNARSSSGDETRVIRSTYGANEFYFDMNVRAGELWRSFETITGRKIFHTPGVLWFCYQEKTPLVDDSIPFAKKHQKDYAYISNEMMRKKFPLIANADLHHTWYDPFGGYLQARESVQLALEYFISLGGRYDQQWIQPGEIRQKKMTNVLTTNGEPRRFDAYLFACGSWLGNLFPDWLGDIITCTRQEVYYFGMPPDLAEEYEKIPVWVDADGKDFYYGIPANRGRGFKIGVDKRGASFDPTHGERTPDSEVLERARAFVGKRFPGLRSAPLLEHRVCPYENSPDGNFVFDVHPEAGNVYALGGGSGHGFKHSPALGELVASVLDGQRPAPEILSLKRFDRVQRPTC